MIFRVRVYADHAIVGKGELVKPLSKLGAKLLEMQAGEAEPEKPVKKEKKTRKKRVKKAADAVPAVEVGDAPANLI